MVIPGWRYRRKQREQREDRKNSDVLEQKDRERRLAAGSLHQVFLVQQLQHNRGRRHRQDEADRDRDLPRHAQEERKA